MVESEPAAEWLIRLDGVSGEASLAAAAATLSRLGFVAILAEAAMRDEILPGPTPEEAHNSAKHRDPAGYLLRRRIARAVAARHVGHAAGRLTIGADPQGKPVFHGLETGMPVDRGLHLGFSERGGVSLVGLGRQRIGVDIECDIAAGAIPWNILRPDEAAALRTLPADAQPRAFLRLWGLKEAFLKASGAVLSIPPEDLRISDAHDISLRNGEAGWQPAAARLFHAAGALADCGNHAWPIRYSIAAALLSETPQ